jgi:hypothetical protein
MQERHAAAAIRRKEMEKNRLAELKEKQARHGQRDGAGHAKPPQRSAKAPAQATNRPKPNGVLLGHILPTHAFLETIDEEFNISKIMDMIIRDRQRSSTGPKKGKSKRVKPKSITGLPGTLPYGPVTLGDPGEERRQKLEDFLNFIQNYYALERENESIKNEILECQLLVEKLRESNPELDIDKFMENIKSQELNVKKSLQAKLERSGAEKNWTVTTTGPDIIERNKIDGVVPDASARSIKDTIPIQLPEGYVKKMTESEAGIFQDILNKMAEGQRKLVKEEFGTLGSNSAEDDASSAEEDEENINITLHFKDNTSGNTLGQTEARLWTSLPLDHLYSVDKGMVKADPYLANSELNNLGEINGKVVVIKRGGRVSFADKINKAIKGKPICIFIVNTDDDFFGCEDINHNTDGLNDRLIDANIPVLLIKQTDEGLCDPANTVSFIRPEAAVEEEEAAVEEEEESAEVAELAEEDAEEDAEAAVEEEEESAEAEVAELAEAGADAEEDAEAAAAAEAVAAAEKKTQSQKEAVAKATMKRMEKKKKKQMMEEKKQKMKQKMKELELQPVHESDKGGGYKRKKTIRKKRKQSKKVKSKRRKRTQKIHKQSKKVKSKRH